MPKIAFEPDKEYGQFIPISDRNMWREAAITAARKDVPSGLEIGIYCKNLTAAWRYPYKEGLAPADWKCEKVKT